MTTEHKLDNEADYIGYVLKQKNSIEMKGGNRVKMDYEKEFKRLQEGGNYWKPKVGQFNIKALSELENTEPFIKKHDGQEDEINQQAKIKILINGEEKQWTFGKGLTLASTYGQLVNLAQAHDNKLMNVEFMVIVKSDGVKNDYTIVVK